MTLQYQFPSGLQHLRIVQKISLHCLDLESCVFFKLTLTSTVTFHRTNIPILSYVVAAITETFILVVRDFTFCIDNVCVLSYKCFDLAIDFNEMWRSNFASALKTDQNRSTTNSSHIVKIRGFFSPLL